MIIYLFILFWVTLTREVCFVLGLSIKDFFLPRAKVVTACIPNEKNDCSASKGRTKRNDWGPPNFAFL